MSTDLAVPTTGQAPAFAATTDTTRSLAEWAAELDAAARLAEALCRTPFVPAAFRGKPESAAAAMLTGAGMGLSPTTSLQIFFEVGGRIGTYADAKVALVRAHGHDVWTEHRSDTSVTVAGRRKGWPVERVERIEVTMEQAKQAGWTKNETYAKTPADMLYHRASGRVCNAIAPEVLYGIPIVDDLADMEPIRAEATVGAAHHPVTAADVLAASPQVSPSQPVENPAAPAPATPEQRTELSSLLRATSRAARSRAVEYIKTLIGREVESPADLTADEVDRVIAALRVEAAADRNEPEERT